MGKYDLSANQVEKILVEQANKAIDMCHDNIQRGMPLTEAFTKLKTEIKKIFRGELIYAP